MKLPRVSVVVASRDRPAALRKCILGLSQLIYSNFEIIVVADAKSLESLASAEAYSTIRTEVFEDANISKARNVGIAMASGDIVAFIDDDSVPEPTWLYYLVQGFEDPEVLAAGGYVLGRNGITRQWSPQSLKSDGTSSNLSIDGDEPVVFQSTPDFSIKTEGTNCAFRTKTLADTGGFDPAFHFFLDETDLNMRLGRMHAKVAIVPMAVVHHGFAASGHRNRNRMPVSLFEIGASFMVFLRKYASPDLHDQHRKRFLQEQRARLVRHMIVGNCEPRDVPRLMETLHEGFGAGAKRELAELEPIQTNRAPFQKYPARQMSKHVVVSSRFFNRASAKKRANEQVNAGARVTAFIFSPTTLFHRVAFSETGLWVQTGGLFGKSERTDAFFQPFRLKTRVAREWHRVARLREIGADATAEDDGAG